ncbi:MAG: protein kinase [Planctomycetota bacterium]|nr:protein kinase [Planctomycetota bacterium]
MGSPPPNTNRPFDDPNALGDTPSAGSREPGRGAGSSIATASSTYGSLPASGALESGELGSGSDAGQATTGRIEAQASGQPAGPTAGQPAGAVTSGQAVEGVGVQAGNRAPVVPASGSGAPRSDKDLIDFARRQAKAAGSGSAIKSVSVDLPPDYFPGYEIVREVHRGGQGVVYQAIQKTTKRKVAIKLLFEGVAGGSRGRARFEREIDILGQLSHPNIVGIIDSGKVAASFYYVMDYISGQPLDAYIASGPRPVEETLRLFAKICDAVYAAHLKGVIHRDIKPGNIRVDSKGEPHVLDFGLAKVAAGEVNDTTRLQMMTMTGQFIGSLPWASPEQAEGVPDKIDLRTDVYSLGVVLFQMLTGGKFPYGVTGNMRDVLDNILHVAPARPSTIRRQINDEVETIVLKALSKERDRRYQSAGELAADIGRYLRGEPIAAKRDSGWYLIKKAAKRHRGPALVGAGFLGLVAGSSVLAWVLYGQASMAEARTSEALQRETAALVAATQAKDREATQRQAVEATRDKVLNLALKLAGAADQIADLRGATGARRYILSESLAVLETLDLREDESPEFLRGVAAVRHGVGRLTASLFAPSTREFARGKAEFQKALALRERVASLRPSEWRSHADLAESLIAASELLQRERALPASVDRAREAEAAGERAMKLATDALVRREPGLEADQAMAGISASERVLLLARARRADAQMRAALENPDLLGAGEAVRACVEQYASIEQAWAEAIERGQLGSGLRDAHRQLGIVADQRSLALVEYGRMLAQRARGSGGRTPEKEESQRLADAAAGSFERALRVASESALRFERMSQLDPTNGRLARDRIIAMHNAGFALQEWARLAGRHTLIADKTPDEHARELAAQALDRWLNPALAQARQLRTSDQANTELWRDVALLLNKSGNLYELLDRRDEARQAFSESLGIRQELLRSDSTQLAQRDVAVALVKMGEVARSAGEDDLKAGNRARALEQLTLAENLWREALAAFGALRDQGAMAADAREFSSLGDPLDRLVARKEEVRRLISGE